MLMLVPNLNESRRSRGRWPTPVDGQSPDRLEYPQQRPVGRAALRGVGLGLHAPAAAGTRTELPFVRCAPDGGIVPKRSPSPRPLML
jgi:hypothetical protein